MTWALENIEADAEADVEETSPKNDRKTKRLKRKPLRRRDIGIARKKAESLGNKGRKTISNEEAEGITNKEAETIASKEAEAITNESREGITVEQIKAMATDTSMGAVMEFVKAEMEKERVQQEKRYQVILKVAETMMKAKNE